MTEETVAKLSQCTMLATLLQGEVLIGIEDDYVLETHLLLLVAADELIEHRRERLACAETQYAVFAQLLLGLDFTHDGIGDAPRSFLYLWEDVSGNLLQTGYLGAVYGRLRRIELLRYFIQYNL